MRRTLWKILLFCLGGSVLGQGGPATPAYLRIETGTHTARIMAMAADREVRILVTAADDKTVRVWDAATGDLQRVIRPPMGDGYEGMVWGLAVSPDGSLIACGGVTGEAWDGLNHVYLFDRATGRMIRRLEGDPGQINRLAWSPDGTAIAAGLSDGGLRLFRAPDWRLAAEDRDYGGAVWGADFHGTGEETVLATTSTDGALRLYRVGRGDLGTTERIKAGGGKQPFTAAFSPDGGRLAVGYFDASAVDVFAVEAPGRPGLRRLFSADTSPYGDTNFSRVCWSADGASLYACGRAGVLKAGAWRTVIRRWSRGGEGQPVDIEASDSIFTALLPLPGGGVAFSDYRPGLGVVGTDGSPAWYRAPATAGIAPGAGVLSVSEGADVVRLSTGTASILFSLADRSLSARADSPVPLSPPRTGGLPVADWRGSFSPTLAGVPIDLDGDYSYCLATAPDGGSFLLGCEWSLVRFGKDGRRLWRVEAPASTLAANLAADGRIAVAAFGDGTVRWYRARDGAALMALFPAADGKRWILWTPSGYYDCSPGAEDLIGWQVNAGPTAAADFFSASRFRAERFRPDVPALVLSELEEGAAVRSAETASGRRSAASVAEVLPPVITLLWPPDGSEAAGAVTVRCSVRCPGGDPVTAWKVLVDGRPAYVERGLFHAGNDGTVVLEAEVVLPEADCTVSAIAENAHAAGGPAGVRVLRPKAAAVSGGFTAAPRLYVLAIGVSRYANERLRLEFSAKDARDFADAIGGQKGLLYRDVSVRTLTDAEATRDGILDGLDWIQKETTARDVAMILLSGHGVNDPAGFYYYLPVDADLDRLKRTCVPFSDVKNTVSSIAGKALFFIDTCHSGNILGRRKGIVDITAVVNELASAENGAVVFASSTGNQYSLEDSRWGNGAFTKALLEGLAGKADYRGKGVITVNMLDLWMSERVRELTDGQQTPTTAKPETVQDFPVAVVR